MPAWEEPSLRRAYEKLIRSSLPGRDPRRITLNTQGYLNVVFDVDGRHIFRFPRTERGAKLLEMELRLLPELVRRLPLRVPDPVVVGSVSGRGWPFMAYERIPGRQLQWGRLTPIRLRTLERELTPTLEALARFPVATARRLGVPGGDPKAFHAEMTDLYRSLKKYGYPVIPERLRAELDERVRAYLDEPANFRFRPALLHGEIHSSHVLWTGEHLSGLIDWGFASLGDPAREFAPWVAHFGTRAVPRMMEGRVGPRDRTFLDRVAFYRFLLPIWQIRNRAWAGNMNEAKEAVRWLKRALRLPPSVGWSR